MTVFPLLLMGGRDIIGSLAFWTVAQDSRTCGCGFGNGEPEALADFFPASNELG